MDVLQPINNPQNEHLGSFIKEVYKILAKICFKPCHTNNVPSVNDIGRTLAVFFNKLTDDTARFSLDSMNSLIELSENNPSSNEEKDRDSPSSADVRNYEFV